MREGLSEKLKNRCGSLLLLYLFAHMSSMWVRDFRVLIGHKSFSWHSKIIKWAVRGEAVSNRDISHSTQPCAPWPWSTSVFYILSTWSSAFHSWASVLSGDRMPQFIVPNTQFGLKLPWSCYEIYHSEASPLTHSPWGCSLSTQKYGRRIDYQLSIFSESNVFICKDKNVCPVRHFSFVFFLWKE